MEKVFFVVASISALIIALSLAYYFLIYLPQRQSLEEELESQNFQEEITKVISYKQTYIPDKSFDGNCWTSSIASQSNPNALRCSVDKNIYDPCFITGTNQIVCDVDPDVPESGFLLELTKDSIMKTEEIQFKADEISPWLIELENGLRCYPLTGTGGHVGDKSFHYQCVDVKQPLNQPSGVLLGFPEEFIDRTNQPWKTTVSYLSEDIRQIEKTEIVEIVKIWK